MVDLTIRRNEKCIIGMPQCGYVFQSSPRCFVGYGFKQSPMEVHILRGICESHGIELVEAGNLTTPGQIVFCRKICSQIITSRFCIVLINDDERDGKRFPNANVCMEYGMMLAFNKYVVPFQLGEHSLSFNMAGLDTVKYDKGNFPALAELHIKRAISDTAGNAKRLPVGEIDAALLNEFFLGRSMFPDPGVTQGDAAMIQLCRPFGFAYFSHFSGMKAVFVGQFSALRPEQAMLRLKQFYSFWAERIGSIPERQKLGLVSSQDAQTFKLVSEKTYFMVIVDTARSKEAVREGLKSWTARDRVEIVCVADIEAEVASILA